MKINIISIGSFKKNDSYQQLFEEYKKRMKWDIKLIEIKSKTFSNIDEQKREEGIILLKNTNKNNKLIVLDERGDIITTNKFEEIITKYEINGGIDFIIGGAEGLSQEVRERADYILSFGKMVFPHLMVRVMLIEQIYRVFTIKNNHPYHK